MRSWILAALVTEVALVAVVSVVLAGKAGFSALAAVGAGAAIMIALALASLLVLLWGRGRSNTAFLASVVGVLGAKMLVVAGALLVVWKATELPRLEFAAGLLGGWIAGFAAQAAVLKATLRKRARGVEP